jgi:hypothetical protein
VSESNQRRIFPSQASSPAPRQVTDVSIVLAPTVNTLTADALSIIQTEIARYKHKSNAGKLDQADHRIIQGYLKSLSELDKSVRSREDDMDLANATDEELLKMVDALRSKKQETNKP